MVISGNAWYAKVLGAPAWGYKNQYKEWSLDVTLDEKTKAKLLEAGMGANFIKDKGDDRGEFLTFKRRETKKDGTPGKAFLVVDRKGQDWDQKKLIGNGSVVNIKIALNDDSENPKVKRPGLIKMQIVDHVAYEGRGDEEELPVYVGDEGGEVWN